MGEYLDLSKLELLDKMGVDRGCLVVSRSGAVQPLLRKHPLLVAFTCVQLESTASNR